MHQNFSADSGNLKRSVKDIRFKIDLSATENSEKRVAGKSRRVMKCRPFEASKNFDSFVRGPSNDSTVEVFKMVAEKPGKKGKYPSLFLHSDSGLGKTHLLNAVANSVYDRYEDYNIVLITAREFMNEMIDSIKSNQLREFRRKYAEDVDVLLIDDIHELKKKNATQNEFFHVFDQLYKKGKQLIFTSDRSPKDIDGISEKIKNRLQWGLIVSIERPGLSTRVKILQSKASTLDVKLSEEIYMLIATFITGSVRELEGAIVKLSAFSEIMGKELDRIDVERILGIQQAEVGKDSIDTIIKECAKYYRVTTQDIHSKSRTKMCTSARHASMYLASKVLGISQKDIAKALNKHHTSVTHGIDKISKGLKKDSKLANELFQIESSL